MKNFRTEAPNHFKSFSLLSLFFISHPTPNCIGEEGQQPVEPSDSAQLGKPRYN